MSISVTARIMFYNPIDFLTCFCIRRFVARSQNKHQKLYQHRTAQKVYLILFLRDGKALIVKR